MGKSPKHAFFLGYMGATWTPKSSTLTIVVFEILGGGKVYPPRSVKGPKSPGWLGFKNSSADVTELLYFSTSY